MYWWQEKEYYFEEEYNDFHIEGSLFNDFMDNADLELLIRAHSYIPYGAKWFFKGRLLSLFSPTEYVGRTLQPKIAKLREDKIKIIDLEKL